MKHLTDEQLEEVLQEWVPRPVHLDECAECQARLAEQQAVRARLRSAFSSVRAGGALIDRIRARLSAMDGDVQAEPRAVLSFPRLVRPIMAVAAALLIAIPLAVYLAGPETASAAEAELYEIHQHGLSPHADLYAHADPEELANYLKERLGFKPALPRLGAGMSLRGCCRAHFGEKPAGSYVVDTDRGVISVVVLKESIDRVDLPNALSDKGRAFRGGSFAKCQIVAVELDGYTYCAIGEVSYEFLADLLRRLVNPETEGGAADRLDS